MADETAKTPGTGNPGNAGGNSVSTGNMPPKVGDISSRLSGAAAADKEHKEGDPVPQTAKPFDLGSLTLEQLQGLKAALANVPDRVSSKLKNPIVLLREFEGDVVVDFSRVFTALVRDVEQNKDVETPMIKIRTAKMEPGTTTSLRYKEFMTLPQVKCEVIKHTQEPGRRVEGQVWSKEHGGYVELEVKTMKHMFTVKLPNGETLDLDSSITNA